MAPQNVDECRDYFYHLIDRATGQPADDWVTVLTNCGIPGGNPPGVKANPAIHWGFTQQVGSGGVRGRLFLPTNEPDPLGFYTHPIDLFDSVNGKLFWAWKDNLGGPPYAPQEGSGGTVPGPQPPSGGGGLTEAQVQAMIDAQCLKYGSRVALRMNSGTVLGVVAGGAPEGQPVTFVGKTDIHAWETLTVERGE